MKKKRYIVPEMEVVSMMQETILAAATRGWAQDGGDIIDIEKQEEGGDDDEDDDFLDLD